MATNSTSAWSRLIAFGGILFASTAGCASEETARTTSPPLFMAAPATQRLASPESIPQPVLTPSSSLIGNVNPSLPNRRLGAIGPVLQASSAEPVPEAVAAPLAAKPVGLSLEQAIQECLTSDPQIRAGRETVNQALADLTTASIVPNPQVTVDGIFLPARTFTPAQPGGPPQNDVLIQAPIDWFVFGKRAAAIVSAQRGVDVSNADFADLVRQRISGTIQAYFDVLAAQASLDISRQNLANFQKVETMTEKRVNLGGVGRIELDRARLALFEARRDTRDKETALVTAKASLRAAMGRNGPEPEFAVAGDLDVPKPAEPLRGEEALAMAERLRPDIISLRRKIGKAEADLNVQRHNAYPSLAAMLGFSRQYQVEALGVPDANSYDAAVVVNVPIFDRNQGNIRKAESTLAQNGVNLESQLVALRAEIVQDVQQFQAAFNNVSSDDARELESAKKVRDSIDAAYEIGGRPLTDVLDAQRAYRDTNQLYISSHSNYWHSLYKLNAAIGEQVLR
jgi:outer membrane protein, heavy metal efflux system